MDHHEIDRRGPTIRRGSDRGFGLTFAAAAVAVGAAPLAHGGPARAPFLGAAAALVVVALAAPALLRPAAVVWFRLGLLLHRVTSPIVLGMIYFLVVTPTALLLRLGRRDLLRLRREPGAASYWLERPPSDAGARWMQRQF